MMICPQPPPILATSRWRLIKAVILMALCLGKPATGQQSEPIDFIRQVAPILQQRCLNCHGVSKAEGGLRLHNATATRRGGDSGAVLVVGKSDQSELLRRLKTNDVEERMPLKLKPLTRKEVQLLVAWIDQGANWPANYTIAPPVKARAEQAARHWAFQPLVVPTLPLLAGQAAIKNGIDPFVHARLQQEKVQLSPASDRVTLIRRVTLDLIGLPPTPAEVSEFLEDRRPDAYQRLVNRLLASPHYGERWARPWMDLCHYADTDGYLTDQQRPGRLALP